MAHPCVIIMTSLHRPCVYDCIMCEAAAFASCCEAGVYAVLTSYKANCLLVILRCLKGPFIATQLNSTRRRVELSCVGEVSIATPTKLNSTRLTYFALMGCTLFNWVNCIADRRRQLSCVAEGVYSDSPTQLNSTRRRVELSCVAINGSLRVHGYSVL